MLGTELVRTEDEVREFYEWLLCRAREEESYGKADNGRVYREYAETVSQEVVIFEDTEKCNNMKGKKNWPGFRANC